VLQQLQQLSAGSCREVVTVPAPAHAPATPPDAPPPVRGASREPGLPDGANPQLARAAAPSAAATTAPGSLEDEDLAQLWQNIIEAVGRASPFTRSYLLEAHPVSFGKNLLIIGFDSEVAEHLELVDNAKSRTLIQTKLSEFGFPDAQVKFVKDELPAKRVAPAPERVPPPPDGDNPANAGKQTAVPPAIAKSGAGPSDKDDFKNDPLIRKALDIFKGQIVEVRA